MDVVAPEHRRVGYLFQEYALFPHLDVARNVRFGARRRSDVAPLLDRFRIADLAEAKPEPSRLTDFLTSESVLLWINNYRTHP